MSPEFKERSVCGYCGEYKRCARLILAKPACELCRLRFSRAPKTCPGCGEVKVLAFYDSDGRPACAACTGAKPVYGCATCGREDSPFGRTCGPCVLSERATALLADATGQVRPELLPVFEALMAARRPRTVLYWFHRSSGPAILRAMAKVLSAGLFDNALASLGEDGSAALSEDARRRRPVGMVTSDRRRGDARLFSCV